MYATPLASPNRGGGFCRRQKTKGFRRLLTKEKSNAEDLCITYIRHCPRFSLLFGEKIFKLFFLPLRAENALAETHLGFSGGRVAQERHKALALRLGRGKNDLDLRAEERFLNARAALFQKAAQPFVPGVGAGKAPAPPRAHDGGARLAQRGARRGGVGARARPSRAAFRRNSAS